ncbi:uncharacterized protein TNCV_3851101 [Trichonephila clavipes]|nr:uncharacterized protein TNCV_3851101 [Trichonephila clavipes]
MSTKLGHGDLTLGVFASDCPPDRDISSCTSVPNVHFPRARHHSKRRRRWVGVKGSTRNGHRNPKCPSSRHLRMVKEDSEAPSEGVTYEWMATDEAVGVMRPFLTMWWSSRRLVCRGRPESSLRVNDISQIYWSQQLLTKQSEWPN